MDRSWNNTVLCAQRLNETYLICIDIFSEQLWIDVLKYKVDTKV